MNLSIKGWKKWAGLGLAVLVIAVIANYITVAVVAKWMTDESEDEQAKLAEEEAGVKTTQGMV